MRKTVVRVGTGVAAAGATAFVAGATADYFAKMDGRPKRSLPQHLAACARWLLSRPLLPGG